MTAKVCALLRPKDYQNTVKSTLDTVSKVPTQRRRQIPRLFMPPVDINRQTKDN